MEVMYSELRANTECCLIYGSDTHCRTSFGTSLMDSVQNVLVFGEEQRSSDRQATEKSERNIATSSVAREVC